MSFSQHVRVTMRFHLHDFHKEADLALPITSTLDELLRDIADFMDVPLNDVPLRATTPAGRPVPRDVNLGNTQLADGSIVLIQPIEELPAPVIRDAAESLAESNWGSPARGVVQLWVLVGLIAIGINTPLPWYFAVAAAAILGIIWQFFHSWLWLSPVIIAASGVAGSTFGISRAALAIAGATALLVFFRRADALVSAAGFTAAAGVGMCAVHPTAAIAGTVLLLAAAPRLSIALARIHVPFIPTAGQDLDITDEPDRQIEQKSVQAHQFYLGVCAGIALSGALAGTLLALVPAHHSWITVAVCLSATVSVLVHAAHHRHAFATWTLMALASVLTVTAVWILTRLTALPLGIVVGLAALSTPWWATKPALLSPTAVSWFERCEIIAIVILLPLAAQASGLFSFIRGLG